MSSLITSENLSIEKLLLILEAVGAKASYEDNNLIMVLDGGICWISAERELKDKIYLRMVFNFKPDSSELDRLRCVNSINSDFVFVKAASGKDDFLSFSWEIPIFDGITPRSFAIAVKTFCKMPRNALEKYGKAIVDMDILKKL